ncbi:MAG TPA: hypothetical protein PLO33_16250 [Kouleothrix sp.]|uniref:DUF7309 domain-containing protein n=1 Tax=Kouleothrix sp. TaxID=2779161 RepID=UPI002B5B4956|nr:hypothetical protein [Kouleothrix sp.]HRC77233.1 hypothetical protein [Kouleothrix sp.]
MLQQEPSTEEWRALFQAAVAFKAVAPWEWMYDSDLFGVQNPEDGEVGYCCVMGNLGEHFALGVYRGTEGLAGYMALQSGALGPEPNPLDVIFSQKCLMASFEDRAYLDKRDLGVIKQLELKFRGRSAWPQFRSHDPGLLPWYITAADARFLALALEQSVDVAQRLAENPELLSSPMPGKLLVRVAKRGAEGLVWSDAWQEPARFVARETELPPLDRPRLQQIKQRLRAGQQIWEVDLFPAPTPIQEQRGERPYYPFMAMVVDHRSGMVLQPYLSGPQNYQAGFQKHVLDMLEMAGALPKELRVASPEVVALLKPIAVALGVKLRETDNLSMLDAARDSLMGYFGGFS